MSAFRLFTRLNDFRGLTGQLLVDGYLKFYQARGTTEADVFGEEELSTNNGSTIQLDSSGRPNVDIWGNVANAYKVEVYAADDSLQGSADDLKVPGGAGATIPALEDGLFLTNDGAVLLWGAIRQLPDPAGQNGKILGVVGNEWVPITKPADGAAGTSDISVGTNSLELGDGDATNYFEQSGSHTMAAPGAKFGSDSVSFPVAFAATPKVLVQPKGACPTSGGNVYPHAWVTAVSTTGFTVLFSTLTGGTSADGSATSSNITGAVDYDWLAIGTKTA
jgi:hypothetical protein